MRFAYCALRDLILRPNATHWFHGTLSLLRLPFDGGGGFLEERAPSIRNGLDLRENLLFLLRRKIGSGIGKPIELALELGPKAVAAERRRGANRLLELFHPPRREIVQQIEHNPSGHDDGRANDNGLDQEAADRSKTWRSQTLVPDSFPYQCPVV